MKTIDDNYITIQGWMVTALNLKGSDLQLFALIHGFCQDRKGRFCGSLTYIENWLNTSRPTCIAAINRLGSAGWIITHVGNINQTNEYSVNWKAVDKAREVVKKLYHQAETGSKETLPVVVKNFNGGSKETLPNIYSNTDNDNIESAPAQFHVQVHSLETIQQESIDTAGAAFDWMQVAKQMEAYAKGDGAAQWRFMCEAQGYKGEVLPIVSNWASKASKYQLMNWKSEFRKLQTWLKTESRADYKAAQRPAYGQQTAAPVVAPAMRLTNPKDAPR